nr:membrane cofactor protein-like [Odocoileus virginianus texanus]
MPHTESDGPLVGETGPWCSCLHGPGSHGTGVDWQDQAPGCLAAHPSASWDCCQFAGECFYLIGAKILYCEISGDNVAWSDNLPICEIIVCAAPGNITNGRFTVYKEVYQYSEVVMYRCNPSNGPDEYSLIGETTLICVDHNRWSSAPPECKVVKCDYPIVEYAAIASGVRRKYYYNAQVVFQCHDGFYLHGNSTVVCGANGTWEPELPKCTKEAIATTMVSTTSSASGFTKSCLYLSISFKFLVIF